MINSYIRVRALCLKGYFLDNAGNDECYYNYKKLENYINGLSDEEQDAIITFNENKHISDESDIVEIATDLIDAGQIPWELKAIVPKLETYNYINITDRVVNCACAFTNDELKIIQKLDKDEDKIINDIIDEINESGKDIDDVDIYSIAKNYLSENYSDFCNLLNEDVEYVLSTIEETVKELAKTTRQSHRNYLNKRLGGSTPRRRR